MSRVYTAADVEGLGEGVSRAGLVLAPGDVISPAALDVARELRIAVRWGDGADDGYGDGAGDGAGDGYGDGAGDAYGELGAAVGSSAGGGSAAGVAGELEQRILREVEEVLREVPGGSVDEVVDRALRRLAQRPVGVEGGTVTERLASFITGWAARGLPPEVTHEAKRAVLNSLGASLAAHDHPVSEILESWVATEGIACTDADHCRMAPVLWSGTLTLSEQAAMLSAAQMHVLDFDDTHIATYSHPAPQAFSAALAEGTVAGIPGRKLLDAVAIGMEVQLAVATMLFPSHYMRGFHITATIGSVGAAAACAVVMGLDREQTVNALGIAMLSSGGLIEAVGTMSNAYDVGAAARSGAVAAQLAARGLGSAATAYEGGKGLMASTSDEDLEKAEQVLAGLGTNWELLTANSYKFFPTETITQAPLECLLAIRSRTPEAKLEQVERFTYAVEPIVAEVCRTRPLRWGGVPQTSIQAKFDLRFCVAAAWLHGRFTHHELSLETVRNKEVIDLRSRVDVEPEEGALLQGARLEISFADGSKDVEFVEAFTGSAANPMSDAQLEAKLRDAAEGRLSSGRLGDVIAAVWALDGFVDVGEFGRLLVVDRG